MLPRVRGNSSKEELPKKVKASRQTSLMLAAPWSTLSVIVELGLRAGLLLPHPDPPYSSMSAGLENESKDR